MNSQLWKTVLDNLDEDIVNSAAERFSKAKYSDIDPESYPADSNPTEYRYSSDKSRSRRRFIIGIGSAAAAVAAGVFILRGVSMPQEVTLPLDGGIAEVSDIPITPVDYIESQNDTTPDIPEIMETNVFSAALFEEYFYGLWGYPTADYDRPMELSYQDSMFGFSAGRTLVGMEKTSDGCYMLAQTDSGIEAWFVPENDRESLFIYRNVQVVNGTVMRKDNGEFICDSCIEHSYDGIPEESDNGRLGYFGIEKLAAEMGVSAEWLLSQELPIEERGAVSTRKDIGTQDMDYVFLMDKDDSSVFLSMRYVTIYTDVNNNETSYENWLTLHFERGTDGTWSVAGYESPGLYFGSDKLHSGLTKEGLTLFKQHFTGWWDYEWSATGEVLPPMTLIYTDDIFTPAEPCVGIAEAADGWAMCQETKDGYRIYYINKWAQDEILVYGPRGVGFISPESCTELYKANTDGKDYRGTVNVSWLGLERYKFMHDENPDGDSLATVIDRALAQELDGGWSAANYTADMEGWDGYRIAEQSENLVLFSYQLFNVDGESRWVTQELVMQGANWTLGELTERVLTNDDIVCEEGFIPVTWSDDFPIESEGEPDGR